MAKIKIPIQLGDPTYFCNKSWTLSFNFNTKSWVSFHSYLPNFYIAENNFFYSGLNDCCGDFDFIATEIPSLLDCLLIGYATTCEDCQPDCILDAIAEQICTTTTTTTCELCTTTTTTTDSSITTTTTLIPCYLEGEASEVCEPSTTTTTSTICIRPEDLNIYQLITGYTVGSYTLNSTFDKDLACSTMMWLREGQPVTILSIGAEADGIYIGSFLYQDNGTDDCSCVPDGWYFTDETMYYKYVFHVEGCIITEYYTCEVTTTTTTLEPPTTTTTTTIFDCELEAYAYEVCAEPTTTTTTLEPTTTTTTTVEDTTTTTTTIPTPTTTTTTIYVPTTTTTTTFVCDIELIIVDPLCIGAEFVEYTCSDIFTTTTTTTQEVTTTTTTTIEPTTTTTTTLEVTTTTTTTEEPTTTTTSTTEEVTTTSTTTALPTTTTTTIEPTTTTSTTLAPTTTTTTVEPTTTTTTSTSSSTTSTTTLEPTTTTTSTTIFVCNLNYSIDDINFDTTTTTTTLAD